MVTKNQQAFFWENEGLTLRQKYSRAVSLFHEHGGRLQQDAAIAPLLAALIPATDALARWMDRHRLGTVCASCAAQPGGCCCSSFMGNNTDTLQLLSNMLLGCMPELDETDADCCPYLGKQGCGFTLKPVFCLNYNCVHIGKHLGAANLQELTCESGKVLQIQFRLEEELLTHLG